MDFTIGRFTLRVRFSFFLLLSVLLMRDMHNLLGPVLLAVLLHELGHCLAMAAMGAPVQRATLDCLGVHIDRGRVALLSPRSEALIHLAGPAANLLLAAGCLFWRSHSLMRDYFAVVNLLLAAVHLTPVGNLDGANLLRLGLSALLPPRGARAVQSGVSLLVLAAALWWVLSGRARVNFTFLLLWLYLVYSTYRGW